MAQAGQGALYKVSLDDPQVAARVELSETLNGADGMVLTLDGELIVVSGSLETVFALRSEDDWASAEITGRIRTEESATTAAVREGAVYVIFSRMGAFNFGQTVDTFPIVRIDFAG